jgi:hypothetical protein
MMSRHYDESSATSPSWSMTAAAGGGGIHRARNLSRHRRGPADANGQRYSLPAGIFFEIDDGLISRVTTTYNLNDWIAQVKAG